MKTSNPVLTRLGQAAERERTAGYGPGYGQPYPTASGYAAAPPAVQPMTIDDVVVKTVILLGITGLSAIAAWNLIPDALLGAAWIGAAVVGLVLGLIISFSRMANPALVIAYAVVEGAFVGLVSKYFEVIAGFEGIVLQAVIATFGVFFVMAVLYRARVIRATPRFTRGLIAVIAGLFFVRRPRRPDLALPGGPAPAELPTRRRLTIRQSPSNARSVSPRPGRCACFSSAVGFSSTVAQ